MCLLLQHINILYHYSVPGLKVKYNGALLQNGLSGFKTLSSSTEQPKEKLQLCSEGLI